MIAEASQAQKGDRACLVGPHSGSEGELGFSVGLSDPVHGALDSALRCRGLWSFLSGGVTPGTGRPWPHFRATTELLGGLYHSLNSLGLSFPISKRVENFVLFLHHLEHPGKAETGLAIPAPIPTVICEKTPPLRLKLWLHPCLYFPCKGPHQLQVARF